MNVLIIHTKYNCKGGEDNVVLNEMELLRSKGVNVELLEFSNDKKMLLKLVQLPFNMDSYRKTMRKLEAFKADVIHIHNLHFGASASVLYAIKRSGIPFVITLHNYRLLCPSATLFHKGKLFLNSIRQGFPWNAITQGVYRDSKLLTFWLSLSTQLHAWMGTWNMCDRYIALTPHSRAMFLGSKLKLHEDQITVKPNFSLDRPSVKAVVKDYFLYVGRLTEEKGILTLLKAFSSSDYKIKIAGDGPLRNVVLDYCRRFSNIEYLGLLNKSEILPLLCACSALIFPSIWYEGMPLTIIEAFGCGTPVIASKMGAMESMVCDDFNGLHFEPGNEKDLKLQLEKWKNLTPEKMQVCRDNASETYDKYYSPEENFQQLYSIYNSVIAERKEKYNQKKEPDVQVMDPSFPSMVVDSRHGRVSRWIEKLTTFLP